ncbi:MAG: MobA [Devosia sp.]|uniref:NTP transferase domain-containing protein n=1 Tax=Devosia sp. TaxID=1871048 RepID=UPI002635EB82|nr:NTP transferase domain-containing protein [Devosia sp.]MDB5538414.1 MobA [Devosia sp.]
MPAALILAGGRGERLGGAIKSELVVGGVRLLDRVAAAVDGCAPVLVAHGRIDPALLRLSRTMIPVPDLDGDYAGPLAGLAGAMAYLGTLAQPPELLVSAAVDTPFLPRDFVERLRAGLDKAAAATSSFAGQPYPTNAIWRVARFFDLPDRLAAGEAPRSLKSLAAAAGGVTVEWPITAAGDPFANVNTPEDLAEMERRAAPGRALFR